MWFDIYLADSLAWLDLCTLSQEIADIGGLKEAVLLSAIFKVSQQLAGTGGNSVEKPAETGTAYPTS